MECFDIKCVMVVILGKNVEAETKSTTDGYQVLMRDTERPQQLTEISHI